MLVAADSAAEVLALWLLLVVLGWSALPNYCFLLIDARDGVDFYS